jgi:protocadherin alpha
LKCFSTLFYTITINNSRDDEITKGSQYRQTIQIRPQNVSIQLAVGQTYDLSVQYEQAEDYPVDLYYLMDLSKSMEDDKVFKSKNPAG